MSEEAKNEVALWQPSEFQGSDLLPVATQREVDKVGRDCIEAEDLIFPSLKLLQGSSEEVKQGIEGARAGLFWLSGAEEAFKPPIRTLACAYTKSRSLFPKEDRPDHAGLEECISRDGKVGTRYGVCEECPYSKWGEERQRPACSESHNFTVLTPMGPAVLRFTGTSTKAARKVLSAWSMSPKPLFAHPLVISTSIRTDKVNGRDSTTHVMETKWAQREDVPPHVQAFARGISEQVMAAHARGKFAAADAEKADDYSDVPY